MPQLLNLEEKAAYQQNIREFPDLYLQRRFKMPYWHRGMDLMLDACKRGIIERKPVVVGSAHAQSKDFLFGRVPFWFLEAYGPAIALLTAPTDRQVKQVMWGEISQAYKTRNDQRDGFGKLFKTRFEISEDWYILPFTTKETGGGVGKFQGFHSPHVMVVFSEAQAIPDTTYDQVEGVLTGEVNLFVILGNPLHSTGRYAQMLQDKRNNIIVNLNALESPNYTEKRVVVPGMATYEWVEDKRRKWGEDDPRWFGRVLGLVPPQGVMNVFPRDMYEKAQNRQISRPGIRRAVGIDPATSGIDDAQIYGMENGRIIAEKTLSGSTDLRIIGQEAMMMLQEIEANTYVYDANGVGDGLGNILEMLHANRKEECPAIHGIKGSDKADDEEQYVNKRAELHYKARDKMNNGELEMPKSDNGGTADALKEEVTSVNYLIKKSRIQIEDPEDLSDRLGHSPNRLSAWLHAVEGMDLAEPIKFTKKSGTKRPSRWSSDDDDRKAGGFMAS